jgi:hypothetical protein
VPFASSQDAESRLRSNNAKLTAEEVRDLMPHMNQISETGMRRLKAELTLQNIEAVQEFERSSSRLTGWIIGLTLALVALTVVIAYYSYVLGSSGH